MGRRGGVRDEVPRGLDPLDKESEHLRVHHASCRVGWTRIERSRPFCGTRRKLGFSTARKGDLAREQRFSSATRSSPPARCRPISAIHDRTSRDNRASRLCARAARTRTYPFFDKQKIQEDDVKNQVAPPRPRFLTSLGHDGAFRRRKLVYEAQGIL